MSDARFEDLNWTSRDGLVLHARDYAPADDVRTGALPVICIPGLTRNCRDFETIAPWIAATGRRVLAVDLRGRGLSARDPDPSRYKPATYARDILDLLDAIGERRAIFIGTSLGGLVTMTVATLRLDAIAGAVINDIGPVLGKTGVARLVSYVGKTALVKTWEDAEAYAKATNSAAFPDYGPDDWRPFARRLFVEADSGAPVLDYDPLIFRKAGPLAMWIGSQLIWRAFKTLARARPTLLVRGAISDILEPSTVARMKRAAPALKVAEVPGVGHGPMLDEPTAKAALGPFLAALP